MASNVPIFLVFLYSAAKRHHRESNAVKSRIPVACTEKNASRPRKLNSLSDRTELEIDISRSFEGMEREMSLARRFGKAEIVLV